MYLRRRARIFASLFKRGENFNRENFNHAIPKLSSRARGGSASPLSQRAQKRGKGIARRRRDKAISLALDTRWRLSILGFFEVRRSTREVGIYLEETLARLSQPSN